MKIRPALALLVGLAATACSGETPEPPAQSTPAPDPDRVALAANRDAWVQALNSHQAAAVADLYADSAWFLNADGSYDASRDEIRAGWEAAVAMSPTASLTEGETMVLGDMAVEWGTYTMQVMADSTPIPSAGAYLVLHRKAAGAWKLLGGLANYDSARPEGWAWAPPTPEEIPPDSGTMNDLLTEWKTHFDLGHADMVADLYTADAVLALPDGPVLRGTQAIAAAFQERMTARPSHITLHDVGTIPLGGDWAFDGGWYELTPPEGGAVMRRGSYLHLVRRQADGTWKIHWSVGNGHPVAAGM